MKTKSIITTLFITTISFYAQAQRPNFNVSCKNAMQKLAFLAGDWKGKAVLRDQNGEKVIDQREHVEWKVDNTVLAIEGIGTQNNEVNFIAFAVVNFDPITQKYKLRSYVKEGLFTDAYFKILEDSKFEWGFDIPAGGKTRYTITLNETQRTWQEIGEYSRDGNSWIKFIELNLNKI